MVVCSGNNCLNKHLLCRQLCLVLLIDSSSHRVRPQTIEVQCLSYDCFQPKFYTFTTAVEEASDNLEVESTEITPAAIALTTKAFYGKKVKFLNNLHQLIHRVCCEQEENIALQDLSINFAFSNYLSELDVHVWKCLHFMMMGHMKHF